MFVKYHRFMYFRHFLQHMTDKVLQEHSFSLCIIDPWIVKIGGLEILHFGTSLLSLPFRGIIPL